MAKPDDNAVRSLRDGQAPVASDRVLFSFDIPETVKGDVRSFGLVEITADEEILASRSAGGDKYRTAMELLKFAIREVNGKPVSIADGSADKALKGMLPKARQLLLAAYAEVHVPSEAESEDFLKTMRARV